MTREASGDEWSVLRREPESYEGEGLVQNAGAEVLSIRRTRREEILLVLKKGGDVSAFEKELDRAVGEKVDVKSLVSKWSLEVRDVDEIVTREEVVQNI